jgi:hypothetical protein
MWHLNARSERLLRIIMWAVGPIVFNVITYCMPRRGSRYTVWQCCSPRGHGLGLEAPRGPEKRS